MNFWHGFAIITVVHLLAAASPGPDFAFVTRQALVNGRKAGLLASVGIALGLSIHIAYSAAGLAAVVAHSVHWMTAIKIVGGVYLVYLGVGGFRSKPAAPAIEAQPVSDRESDTRIVIGGLLCNAFNPKAPIYFVALFTVVLSPSLPWTTLVAYGLWLMLLQWLWFALVASVFAHGAVRARLNTVRHWIDRAFGLAMVALGIRVLASLRE